MEDFPHDAVYWERNGTDDVGTPKFKSPVQIKCDWEKVQVRRLNERGEVKSSAAVVEVSQALAEGSLIRLGHLTSVPSTPDNLFEVATYNEEDDIHGEDPSRWVELERYNGPAITIDNT